MKTAALSLYPLSPIFQARNILMEELSFCVKMYLHMNNMNKNWGAQLVAFSLLLIKLS